MGFDDAPFGAVTESSGQADAFGPVDEEIVRLIASYVSGAARRLELFGRAITRVAQIEGVNRIAQALQTVGAPEEKVDSVIEPFSGLLEATISVVLTWSSEDVLTTFAYWSADEVTDLKGGRGSRPAEIPGQGDLPAGEADSGVDGNATNRRIRGQLSLSWVMELSAGGRLGARLAWSGMIVLVKALGLWMSWALAGMRPMEALLDSAMPLVRRHSGGVGGSELVPLGPLYLVESIGGPADQMERVTNRPWCRGPGGDHISDPGGPVRGDELELVGSLAGGVEELADRLFGSFLGRPGHLVGEVITDGHAPETAAEAPWPAPP